MAFRCAEYPLIQKCFGPGTKDIVDGVTPSCELFIPCILGYTCRLTSGGPGRASEEVSGSGCGCRLWLGPVTGFI